MSNPTNKGSNQPSVKATLNFRIDIELDAVVDYMTMLRGFSAHGDFYEGFVSDQLTRFPDFSGLDWEDLLPHGETFESFLSDAIAGNSPKAKKLFSHVRPYDFAYRDLTYLRRNGAQIIIHVPPLFEPHMEDIQKWTKKYFPINPNFIPARVIALGDSPYSKKSDVWVVRNPTSAQKLRNQGQPFILIDGKENANLENVIRVVRWDQAGFLLRHAQLIKHLTNRNPHQTFQKQPTYKPVHPPHMDIFQGNPIQLLLADDALLWIGQQLKSLNIAMQNPETVLKHGRNPNKPRKQFSEELTAKVMTVLEIDKQEVQRKARFLTEVIDHKMEQIYSNPDWTSVLKNREAQMDQVLCDLETELRIDPVTGGELSKKRPVIDRMITPKTLSERMLSGNANTPIILQLSGAEVIHLFSRNWSDVRAQVTQFDPANIAGHLAEIATKLIVEEGKWKLLRPSDKANGLSSSKIIDSFMPGFKKFVSCSEDGQGQQYGGFFISWHNLDTGELRSAEVDFVAKGPGNIIVIGEVKLSGEKPISDLQAELRDHISKGGRVINPGFQGVRSKTFKADWREIRINDHNFDIITPSNDISSMQQGI